MEAAPTCVCPVDRTTPVPAPPASARSAATPVPRVSGSGAPASVDLPCEGGWSEQSGRSLGIAWLAEEPAPQVAPGEEEGQELRAPRSKLRAEGPALIPEGAETPQSQA